MNKYKVIPLSREYITQKAIRIREATKTEIDFLFPVEKMIEYLLECMEGSLEIIEDNKLPNNIPAKTIQYPNINSQKNLPYTIIQVKESVYLGAIEENPEDRFTLAHEIGHAFLLHGCMCNNICKKNEIIPPIEDPEWQADTFAKELLAPSYLYSIYNHNFIAKVCKIPIEYAKQQSDYVLATEMLEHTLNRKQKSNYNSNYIINKEQEVPFPLDQTLLVPLNSPFFRKLRITKP